MTVSKYGVAYDMRTTPYTFMWRGMEYHFSTEAHLNKFRENVVKREEWLDDSLSRRFRCSVHLPILADIQLYTKVETRGFRIVTEQGVAYESPAHVFVHAQGRDLGVGDGWV